MHILKEQFGAGNEFYNIASKDLSIALPDVKSFSPTNLKYMQYFFELYSGNCLDISGPQVVDRNDGVSPQVVDLNIINRPQLVDDFKNTDIFEIPWGHHRFIIDASQGNMDKALFYVRKTYSRKLQISIAVDRGNRGGIKWVYKRLGIFFRHEICFLLFRGEFFLE